MLNAFSVAEDDCNETFRALNDFNLANAQPIIRGESGTFILFQAYSFYEALYESPFYWMLQDAAYKDTALKHRGEFTEGFSAQCLARVFGIKHTHANVLLHKNAATTAGEIDNLVLFGNRAIVVQAKSKRLTLEARKGNDGAIQKDFSAGITDAYQQALFALNIFCAGRNLLLARTETRWLFRSSRGSICCVWFRTIIPHSVFKSGNSLLQSSHLDSYTLRDRSFHTRCHDRDAGIATAFLELHGPKNQIWRQNHRRS